MKKKSDNYLKRLMLYFAIVLGIVIPSTVLAQEAISVKGTVFDSDGLSIPGVTVVVQGTTRGTITGIDGEFSITAPKGSTLEFSFIGYERQSVLIDDARDLRIVLVSDVVALSEVVVVGYGVQRKESVVGAIGQISSENMESIPVTNISHAITGQAAGITTFQSTGELGNESATIRIRGIGSYTGSQQPLFVIDGLIRDAAAFNALDVYDISGINILKDASATAVYGVRGANGVIIVTTQRGRAEVLPPQFTATVNLGVGSPTALPRLVDSHDWAVLMNEGIVNDGMVLENHPRYFTPDELWKLQNNRDFTPGEVAAMDNLTEDQKQQLLNSPAIYYGDTDYFKEFFGSQLAPHQKYNVNVRGGTRDISYFSSVGYSNQGTYLNDHGFDINSTNINYEKFNARTNLDFTSIPHTTIRTSMSAYVHNGDQLGVDGDWDRYKTVIHTLYTMAPWFGEGVYDNKIVMRWENPPPDMLRKQESWFLSPIAWHLTHQTTQSTRTNIDLSVRGEHRFDYLLEGLQVNGTVSFDQSAWELTDRNDRIPTYIISRDSENPNEIIWTGGEHNTQVINERAPGQGWGKTRRFYVDGGISYANSFGLHNVSAMSLLTAERYTTHGLMFNIPQGIYGLVGRATYDYASKYLFEFNIGYNGSENFAEDRRFGTFPAIAAGWVASNEDFFPENSILTLLKLRGSYGQVGNSNIGGGRFLYLPGNWGGTTHLGRGYYFGDADGLSGANPVIQGIFENSVGNPFVTWETKTSYNIGLETSFFNDKLSITPEYFHEKRDDILSRIQTTPVIIGLDNSVLPFYNVGTVTNKGYEIEVSLRDRISRDFSYNLFGHFSYVRNKIDYMAETMQEYDWMNTTGFSVGQFKGFKSDGLYNTEEELVNRPVHSFLNDQVQLGDIRYVDINGDGIIDDRDRVPIGYSNLPQLNFGFSSRINYKGWGLFMQFTGSARGTFNMTNNLRNPFRDYNPTSPMQYMTERWSQERYDNGEKISFPRVSTEPVNTPNEQNSDYWIRSTDFLKLKNLELSYNFGSGIRIYVNANNIYTWRFGDLPDYVDPEQANSRSGVVNQGWIYPIARVYNIGLSVKL